MRFRIGTAPTVHHPNSLGRFSRHSRAGRHPRHVGPMVARKSPGTTFGRQRLAKRGGLRRFGFFRSPAGVVFSIGSDDTLVSKVPFATRAKPPDPTGIPSVTCSRSLAVRFLAWHRGPDEVSYFRLWAANSKNFAGTARQRLVAHTNVAGRAPWTGRLVKHPAIRSLTGSTSGPRSRRPSRSFARRRTTRPRTSRTLRGYFRGRRLQGNQRGSGD